MNVIEGGQWHTEKHDYFSLPLLVRPNSILPVGKDGSRPDYDYADEIAFHVFELEDGKTAVCEVCDKHGKIEGKLKVSREKNTFTAAIQGAKSETCSDACSFNKTWFLCLRNIHSYKSAQGAKAKDEKEGLLFYIDKNVNQVVIEL
jgi:alpha-D-xyloside xylohydrolase